MKIFRFIIFFLVLVSSLEAQTNQPFLSVKALVSATPTTVALNVYELTANITDETNVYDGLDVTDSGDMYYVCLPQTIGDDINIYRVTSIVSQFVTQVTIQVTDHIGGQGTPNTGVQGLAQEDRFNLLPWVSGASEGLNQGITQYNNFKIQEALRSSPSWVNDQAYQINDVVAHNGQLYTALVANIGLDPGINPTEWNLAIGGGGSTVTGVSFEANEISIVTSGGTITGDYRQVVLPINQTSHGFSRTDIVTVNTGGTWIGANTTDFAIGLVRDSINSDSFNVAVNAFYIPSHGKNIGEVYYATATDGQTSITSPAISHPIYFPITNDYLVLLNERPFDSSASVSGNLKDDFTVDLLTIVVTGSGGTATLSETPNDDSKVRFFIDGMGYDALAGSGAVVSGTSVTFTNATLGITLTGTERITAEYFKQ